MGQALGKTECHRVGHKEEDQRNRRSSGVDRNRVLRPSGNDDLRAKRDELSHERGDLLGPALRVTIFDLEISAHDIASLA